MAVPLPERPSPSTPVDAHLHKHSDPAHLHAHAHEELGRHGGRHESILDAVGHTPLVAIPRMSPNPNVRIYAKLEMYNPTGSVKDRAAKYLVEDLENRGVITPDSIILEPTSGNTGIALAMIGRRKGYRVVLVMPDNVTSERRQVAALFWLVPFGRLTGALLVVLPVVTVAAFSVGPAEPGPFQLSLAAAVYAAAIASGVLALAPATGGSAAAAAGFVAAWVGAVPPLEVRTMFENWPFLQRALDLIWHMLPLQWRAARLLDTINWIDVLVLSGWIVIGVALAGWVTTPVRSADRRFRGRA